MQFLGNTLPEIACEKAGIIKTKIPVVIGESQEEVSEVFCTIAKQKEAPIHFADQEVTDNFESDLKGEYQQRNIKTVIQTCKLIQGKGYKISEQALREGLMNVSLNTGLKGRWQVLQTNPKVICDTAHNREGLSLVMDQLKKESFQNLHIVMGMVNDKDLSSILYLFPKSAQYYFCKPDIPRGLDATELKDEALKFGFIGEVYPSVNTAYHHALDNAIPEDIIYVGGSTFVVAELPL